MKNLYLISIFFAFTQCKNKEIHNNAIIDNKIAITNNQADTLNKAVEKIEYKNDTISKIVYKNGKINHLILVSDSINAQELHLSFYLNGNLKSKGLQGNISNKDVNTKMSIETWFYYDVNKNLDSTIYYSNAEYGKDFIEKKFFYKNGKIKSIERFSNYILYENSIDSIGVWKSYNTEGKLIKTIKH